MLNCSAVDVSRCTVSGRGIQPRGVRVNDLAVFHVSTLNAGQGDLDVSVSKTRGGTKEPVKVVKVGISCLSNMVFADDSV